MAMKIAYKWGMIRSPLTWTRPGGCSSKLVDVGVRANHRHSMYGLFTWSNEKKPGCLGYRGWNTTRFCGEYNKPL